jgi:uracil-DNA glycosylase family protein
MTSRARADSPGATPYVPASSSLIALATAARACRGCPLWEPATQTVFGEGSGTSPMMLIGEQPGDREDVEGAPFVGPAGHLLDQAMDDASLDRSVVYVTNAVKHFKWTPRGKRRIHQNPNRAEIAACRPWLEQEVAIVRPQLLVCLGATAAGTVLGSKVRVTRDHGQFFDTALGPPATVTLHPSAVLRSPDEAARESQYQIIVGDLRAVAERLAATR